MSTVPGWIRKENDQKAEAKRKAEAAVQRQAQAADFIRERGMGFWDQLALALRSNAQALEKLEGEELHGSASKSVTGTEHNIYVRIERRSVKHGPFHIAMRFTNLQQLAKGINAVVDGGTRSHALAEIDRAKWRLWNGLAERGIVGLVHLGQWAQAPCFDPIPDRPRYF